MKKIILGIACLFYTSITFAQPFSETGLYEKDLIIITDNIDYFSNISRNELIRYSQDFQKLVFVNINNLNKKRLWSETLSEYASQAKNNQSLSEAIAELTEILDENLFQKDYDPKILEAWVQKNVEKFGKVAIQLITTGMNNSKSIGGIGVIDLPIPNPGNPSPPASMLRCNCSQISDWCGGGAYCKSWVCHTSTGGCGTLWRYECDGRCYTPND